MSASPDRLLRRTLWSNAIFSAASGAVMAILASPLAGLVVHESVAAAGLDFVVMLELLGLGLIAFGAGCAWITSRQTLPAAWARAIFAADLAWVAGSLLVLGLPAVWTTVGIVGVSVQALIVADIAVLEYLGLRRLGADH